ncbi:MAG TPA: hypothetical protein VGT08_19710 [Terracidiphilus sp.]|nr:hypothetical protein [Terracidiphilus sp.]
MPEASLFLDLAKERFDDGLAHLVNSMSSLGGAFLPGLVCSFFF